MAFYYEDIELAERIVKGDSEAENQLFKCFGERINLLVRARLRCKIPQFDQEDIVSEIHQAVLLNLRRGGYNSIKEKPLEAYIAGIAGNTVALYFRNLKKEIPSDSIDKVVNLSNHEISLSGIITDEKKRN